MSASRFFSSAGLRLHVLDHGGAGRPVVFLHGGSAHARWWDFVVPHLGDGLHAYALDLRGHGDSEWARDSAYAIEDYARDLSRMLEAFGLEEPALVGHSFGSFVGLHYAVAHPRELSALVLVDGRASFGGSGSRTLKLLGMFGAAEYGTLEEAVGKFRPLPKETIAAPQVVEHVARHGFRKQGERWTTKFDRASLASHAAFDLKNRLGELDVPVLFVRGERSEVISAAAAARLAAACRQGAVVEIPQAHHHVLIDRPEELGREIAEFLKRVAKDAQKAPRVLP